MFNFAHNYIFSSDKIERKKKSLPMSRPIQHISVLQFLLKAVDDDFQIFPSSNYHGPVTAPHFMSLVLEMAEMLGSPWCPP